ncbi:MAG: phosphomannose isomerase type II C-terminal cupin domain [Rhodospirillales bacterium]|nr:phosphomannose isomerase type II C-terminal cupin domain [Alphaproteobacteria bacterium]MCB9981424.1 phosphomannose isomerase type II C-terminal cupin domain [Rhodospirillales bacterium]
MTLNTAINRVQRYACDLEAYKIGDSDTRPWGSYVVTGVGPLKDGSEYCEKTITLMPGKILSLQSHELRTELWRVEEGTLTVVLNRQRLTLNAGDTLNIPLRSVHCMANLTGYPCKVYEKQTGICREEDIIRYVDAYGRKAQTIDDAKASVTLYREILDEIKS